MECYRKSLNSRQTELRRLLSSGDRFQEAMDLFLSHHALLHSAKMARTGAWSFEDGVLDDITEEQMRRVPQNCEHSVAWCFWHIARCEDITLNLLVAGSPQVLLCDDWHGRMKVKACDTGNAMDEREMAALGCSVACADICSAGVGVPHAARYTRQTTKLRSISTHLRGSSGMTIGRLVSSLCWFMLFTNAFASSSANPGLCRAFQGERPSILQDQRQVDWVHGPGNLVSAHRYAAVQEAQIHIKVAVWGPTG